MLKRGDLSGPYRAVTMPRIDRHGRFCDRDRETTIWDQPDELEGCVTPGQRVASRATAEAQALCGFG